MEEKVLHWAKVFGLPVSEFSTIPKNSDLAVSLVKEEVNELLKAVEEKDIVGIADGVCDAIWVIIRLAHEHGLKVEQLFEEVYASNMSKAISIQVGDNLTDFIVSQSKKDLINKGKAKEVEVVENGGYLILKNSETKKVLKPITFIEPNLKSIIEQNAKS